MHPSPSIPAPAHPARGWGATHERSGRPACPPGLLLAGAAGLLLTWLYRWAVLSPAGRAWDQAAMEQAAVPVSEARWAAALLDLISPDLVVLAAAVTGLLAFAVRGVLAGLAAVAVAGSTALGAVVLKNALTRPDLLGANSFPSGHVAAVAGVAAALVLAAPPTWRPLLLVGGGLAVALTGTAVVQLQWHRPSDVLAAGLLAVIAAGVASAVLDLQRRA